MTAVGHTLLYFYHGVADKGKSFGETINPGQNSSKEYVGALLQRAEGVGFVEIMEQSTMK
jgi:hypothetical protein